MDAPEDQKPPPEAESKKTDKSTDAPPKIEETINRDASLKPSDADKTNPPLSEEDRARLQKEYDLHIHSYEFYLEYGLKAVAVFYAVIGGILSVYFGGSRRVDSSVLVVLLGLPILMSIILGCTFLWGARKWNKMSTHIQKLADDLIVKKPPDIVLLTSLLYIFGGLYLLTALALGWLMAHWINVSPL